MKRERVGNGPCVVDGLEPELAVLVGGPSGRLEDVGVEDSRCLLSSDGSRVGGWPTGRWPTRSVRWVL